MNETTVAAISIFVRSPFAAPTLAALSTLAAAFMVTQANAGDPALGRDLFEAWSCSGCHTLADAGSAATIGPSLDGNPNLTLDYVISRIKNGGGAMPPFDGQLTESEIDALAEYIIQVAK